MRRNFFQTDPLVDISAELDTVCCVTSDKTKALEGDSLGRLLNKTMMKHMAYSIILGGSNQW